MKLNKIIVFISISILTISFFSGCTDNKSDNFEDTTLTENFTLTVSKVEKRLYNDYGNAAYNSKIFLYVYFTIKNYAIEDLFTSTVLFELKSDEGEAYSPDWIIGVGSTTSEILPKGESASYYMGFQIPENANVTEAWTLNYDGFQGNKSTNLVNIPTEVIDPKYVTLTIDDYYFSETGDYLWMEPSEGNRFIFVNITLNNSEDSQVEIDTSRNNFKLYTTDGGYTSGGDQSNKPDSINIGSKYSWYLYFEIPEDAVLDKLVYDTISTAPAEASFNC